MAKKVKSFYYRFFLGALIIPLCKLLGLSSPAVAALPHCNIILGTTCKVGDTQYVACGTNSLQKQICEDCTFTLIGEGGWDSTCSCYQEGGEQVVVKQHWIDSGACTTYANECSYEGQTTSGGSCTTDWGSGTITKTCKKITVGTKTYLMWQSGDCSYTSCKISGDVLFEGRCWCTVPCDAANGYARIIAESRWSSLCHYSSSSSV